MSSELNLRPPVSSVPLCLQDVHDRRPLRIRQGRQIAGFVFNYHLINFTFNYSGFESLMISVTGALINLVLILFLSFLYDRIAVWLTDKELHR